MTVRWFVRRLLQCVPAVAGILVVTFFLVYLLPGDPAVVLAGEAADPTRIAEVRAQFGLDRSVPVQFVSYAGNVLRGNFGDSFSQGLPVRTVIAQRWWPTLLLSGTALLFSSMLGIILGALAARRPYGRLDLGINGGIVLIHALPGFWLAQLAILAFSVHNGWFPVGGMTDARTAYSGLAHWRDIAFHLILPAGILCLTELAVVARIVRSGLLDQMGSRYASTALAKGLSPWEVLTAHALRNALLPAVTVIGGRVGTVLAGTTIIETIFSWPGLGRTLVDAAQNSDRPLILGLVLLGSVTVVVANLLTDLVYAVLDPRIRHA